MRLLEATGIGKVYQSGDLQKTALHNFSLSVERGGFVAIVGKSGSGKTTFLRIIAGLTERTSGELSYQFSRLGMVFQEPRLMPWLSVTNNVLFPYLKEPAGRRPYERAGQLLQRLGLTEFKNARPSELSGGMAQRVAIGRALIHDPELILLDEPLGSLDYFTRRSLQNMLVDIYLSERNKTFFLVTHDIDEAVMMARRVVVLRDGEKVGDLPVDLPYPRRKSDVRISSLVERTLQLIEGG